MSEFKFSGIQPGADGVKAIFENCYDFLLKYGGNKVVEPERVLSGAEEIAKQILLMYPDFNDLSLDFKTHFSSGDRIHAPVRRVLVLATVREHEQFGQLIDAMHPVYQNHRNIILEEARETRHDLRFTGTPKPTLWDETGLLKYEPAAFALFHEPIFRSAVNGFLKAGAPGVEKILADYPLMSKVSQEFMDQKILEHACSFRLDEDDLVRWVLRHKITPDVDAMYRLKQVFETSFVLEEGSMFMETLDHLCALLPRLSNKSIHLVLQGVENLVEDWVAWDRSTLLLPDVIDPRACLRLFMDRMRPYGLDVPGVVQQKLNLDHGDKFFVESLLDGVSCVKHDGWTTNSIWMAAALDGVSDERIALAGLDESELNFLYQERGSECLRQALLKTSKGRDLVFSGDLGL